MKSQQDLRLQLKSIDHKSYPSYKSLRGAYRFPRYVLSIDHVQGDPFAAPSDVSVTIDTKAAGFPAFAMKDKLARTALADLLLREFAARVNRYTFKAKGSGKSGLISVSLRVLQSDSRRMEGRSMRVSWRRSYSNICRSV